ncbi:MAG: insulinase family protein [Saprospiraceae bacterium]|nr:insulinase family protein [Saprospiraceae bacterium]
MNKPSDLGPKPKLSIPELNWDLQFPVHKVDRLESGSKIYSLPSSNPQLCYFELVFENGRRAEIQPLTARMTAAQIQEGSKDLMQSEIVDFFDFHGCSYSLFADLDFTIFSVSCLQKHFEKLIDFSIHLLAYPSFPEDKLAQGKIFMKSQLSHQLTEPDYVSYREMTSHLYGPKSFYAYNSTSELIDGVTREQMVEYHQSNYTQEVLSVFYVGKTLDPDFWATKLSILPRQKKAKPAVSPMDYGNAIINHFPIPHCSQTSLKIGCGLFAKSDADYDSLYVINSLLGDYFGSRLMRNIREEQGLTYDIHSTLDVQLHGGCFYIGAEINAEEKVKTVELIKLELRKLRSEPVPPEELQMVKNYLNGHLLRLIDGPFQSVILLKILMMEFKSISAFDRLVDKIKNIDSDEILTLADKYLHEDKMSVITAGV